MDTRFWSGSCKQVFESGCMEEINAKVQGRKGAKVVDLPQRSGCLAAW
jgi:hypothetical protein